MKHRIVYLERYFRNGNGHKIGENTVPSIDLLLAQNVHVTGKGHDGGHHRAKHDEHEDKEQKCQIFRTDQHVLLVLGPVGGKVFNIVQRRYDWGTQRGNANFISVQQANEDCSDHVRDQTENVQHWISHDLHGGSLDQYPEMNQNRIVLHFRVLS